MNPLSTLLLGNKKCLKKQLMNQNKYIIYVCFMKKQWASGVNGYQGYKHQT